MNTFHFFKTNREFVLNIQSGICIMSKFAVIMKLIFLTWNTKTQMPFQSFFLPVFVPFFLCARTYKKLHLHLFKLPHSENKLAGYNFIAESFTNLRNAKRYFKS